MRARIAAFVFALLPMATGPALAQEDVFFRIGSAQVLGDSPHALEAGGGIFDISDASAAALKLEGRFGRKLFFVGPAAGVLVHGDGGGYLYGGLYAEVRWGRFSVTPLVGVGLYEEGDGKDLGGTLAFRSSLVLSYRPSERLRVGAGFAHISNGDLYDENPGENDLFLTAAFSF